ncbi:MAG TPA: hypothetical protein VKX41_12965 [Alloacidobacterium sp.]|jgi:hypothetical protein|nr:hypothetical protein [Alloacidobacterium sp.]
MKAATFMRKYFAVLITALLFGSFLPALAQSRLSDKDVQQLMNNLHNDVKAFRSPFNSALSKSPIHKTSQETDAKNLARQLENQTGDMLNAFKKNQKADDAFRSVNSTAQQLDSIVRKLGPQSAAAPAWAKVQNDLNTLNPAFGISTPPTGAMATCTQAVGAQRASELVSQCQQVTTATSSPCNAQNTCKMITDEIRRGCSQITSNAPSFCAEYQ